MALSAKKLVFSPAVAALCLSGLLSACSLSTPKPDQHLLDNNAATWQTNLPPSEKVDVAQNLSAWWDSWNDATLSQLQQVAQQQNQSLAQATARIGQARADAAAAGAALWPSVNLTASVTAGRNPQLLQTSKQTLAIAGLDAKWEVDLFGAVSVARRGVIARLNARETEWHDARISLAAEVANTYISLRVCEAQADLQQRALQSQELAQQLTTRKAEAGFISPLELAQQAAVVANVQTQLQRQQSDCAVLVKSLVVLSTLSEAELRQMLSARRGQLPQVSSFIVDAVPAKVLLQRPDLRASLYNLTASAAEIGVAEARRYPSISLLGSINVFGVRIGDQTMRDSSWSFGPSLDLPLFDAGKRKAAVDGAQARYAETLAAFRQQSLIAIREVEEAMVRLNTVNQHLQSYAAIEAANTKSLESAEAGVRFGSNSVLDKEDALRQQLSSQQQKLSLQRDQASAWIALYKAVGGDWKTTSTTE